MTESEQGNKLEMNRPGGSVYVPMLLNVLCTVMISVVHCTQMLQYNTR